jgi:hypothetical protein
LVPTLGVPYFYDVRSDAISLARNFQSELGQASLRGEG